MSTCVDEVERLVEVRCNLLVLQGKHPGVERDPHSEPGVLGEREARGGAAERVPANGRTAEEGRGKSVII